jgi:NADH:ubiquinone oxidoreductase subunit 2 (subunit N)
LRRWGGGVSQPGERIAIGGLGMIGLVGAAISAAMLWNRNAEGFGVIVADNFGLFVTLTLVIVGMLTIMFSSQVLERDGMPSGEYYSLGACSRSSA